METTFLDWMKEVDRHMLALAGVTHEDVADHCWLDWYDDDVSVLDAVEWALECEGLLTT